MNSFTGLLPSPTSASGYAASPNLFAPNLGPVVAIASMLPTATVMNTLSSAPAFSSTLMGIISTTSTAAIESGKGSKHHGATNGECKLLGPFALFIQGALGALALLSLVYKRWRERPQRPVKVWAFDASKQVVGSVLLHIANLFMSMFSSGQIVVSAATIAGYQANPCSFYLLNLAIDVSNPNPYSVFERTTADISGLRADYNRHTHPHRSSSAINPCVLTHTLKQSTRIHTFRQLRASAKNDMVAQTIPDLLPRPPRHENLRVLHLPDVSVDNPRWRLVSSMDRRQRGDPDSFCHATVPSHYERPAVLYHR